MIELQLQDLSIILAFVRTIERRFYSLFLLYTEALPHNKKSGSLLSEAVGLLLLFAPFLERTYIYIVLLLRFLIYRPWLIYLVATSQVWSY
jgi:hypothetical protein